MISEYKAWYGKTEVFKEQLSEINCIRLYQTLNLKGNPPSFGETVFPMALLILGEPSVSISEVGEDGHPLRGGLIPPITLKRRMFAGGKYDFYFPLRVGDEVKISYKINNITRKYGKSGELIFVNIHKNFYVEKLLCATEIRDIVFTDSDPKSIPVNAPEKTSEWVEEMKSDPLQLFRFSALTFNGHRIHYDRTYANEVEGYPGLVVHGPLLATLLSLFAEKKSNNKLKKFVFKGQFPVFEHQKFTLTGERIKKNFIKLRVLDHKFQAAIFAEGEFF